jgi:drug/metabolite transporter (DMT)-like permease
MNKPSAGLTSDGAARHRVGLVLLITAAAAWSTGGFFTRLIHLDSWTMLVWRGLFGALGMLPFIVWRKRGATFRSFRRVGAPGLVLALITTLSMTLFIASLGFTTVAHVYIVYATVPFLAAGLAWMLMRERPSPGAVVAGLFALVGVAIMVGLSSESGLFGDLLALGMTLGMAAMMVIAPRYQSIAVLQATFLASLLSGLISIAFAGHLWAGGMDFLYLALFGVVNSAIGIVLFTLGSQLLPAIKTGLISLLEVPLGPVWVWFAFGETRSAATITGGLVVFTAVVSHTIVSDRYTDRA